ncbi:MULTISPECIES: sugar ABC transporter permease [unclassified Granulicatella]|uniref:sugar ABC transporter permease n=1 Tax=unclassified Granulicatella TaxID=2630493 RepID=UPI001073DB86|nr:MULTISPECIES: sugar ABC transporter permease [unclassified Granulicatella]MBF0779649.1 sugar ABC transporter permease [Granulicatella sp. 19428wC4_WM01]TFU96305.1 sugar ABC transporter permease [Granulicatella sp. WM01]
MNTKKNEKVAIGLSTFFPGAGQFYNGQWFKGIVFASICMLFIYQMAIDGVYNIDELFTLGYQAGRDNSLFMLIRGVLQCLIIAIYAIFHVVNVIDARKIAKMWNNGEKVAISPKENLKNVYQHGFPYVLVTPAYLLMIFVILFPVIVSILIALTNYDFQHIPPQKLLDWVGFDNFIKIGALSTFQNAFLSVLGWTIIWSLAASTLQIVMGIFTAVVANQSFVKGKRIFGIIFLLPWAVPGFITILTFSNMFNDSLGAINTQVLPFIKSLFPFLDFGIIPWKTDPFWTKFAVIFVQAWLATPYIYVLTLGILQAIPHDLYEAATIDGANAWQKFKHITFPTILAVAAPSLITQYTGNFNNFSVIYLFNQGGPGSVGGGAGSTDILISWIYKLTTSTSPQFSLAAAVTLIISIIVIGISLVTFKKLHAFEMED